MSHMRTLTKQAHVCVQKAWVGGWVDQYTLCVCGSLLIWGPSQSGTGTRTGSGGNHNILSQKVYGELRSYLYVTCEEIVESPSFSADCPDYMELFRKYVSSNAAGKGRAVLEGVGLEIGMIKKHFWNNPRDVVEAVQSGLIEWSEGHQCKQPTWEVLLGAMKHAQIAKRHIEGLKKDLGLHWKYVKYVVWCMLLAVTVAVLWHGGVRLQNCCMLHISCMERLMPTAQHSILICPLCSLTLQWQLLLPRPSLIKRNNIYIYLGANSLVCKPLHVYTAVLLRIHTISIHTVIMIHIGSDIHVSITTVVCGAGHVQGPVARQSV